ncbi:hypothetical protein TNCT_317431 [Trichonephila clavata]|uniref:Uncharacterized protein n=1 Tax=Trichonephila clavata TaxID=2740835 RepID=A0A8X6KF83_TRICU|nr:hypothetical protein TNCT_317431 [Trichonephila clavata]
MALIALSSRTVTVTIPTKTKVRFITDNYSLPFRKALVLFFQSINAVPCNITAALGQITVLIPSANSLEICNCLLMGLAFTRYWKIEFFKICLLTADAISLALSLMPTCRNDFTVKLHGAPTILTFSFK